MSSTLDDQRRAMVKSQIAARGVRDERVLDAMGAVPRERFVPEPWRRHALADGALPIGAGQTISQPLIVAMMAEALELGPDDRVLEVGSGSGYAAAVFARLCREVWGIERLPELAARAQEVLRSLHADNVNIRVGDGTLGLPAHAPFDAIVVSAAAPHVPRALVDQLAFGGRLVIPVGDEQVQTLLRLRKHGDGSVTEEALDGVRFVPLIGEDGWPEDQP